MQKKTELWRTKRGWKWFFFSLKNYQLILVTTYNPTGCINLQSREKTATGKQFQIPSSKKLGRSIKNVWTLNSKVYRYRNSCNCFPCHRKKRRKWKHIGRRPTLRLTQLQVTYSANRLIHIIRFVVFFFLHGRYNNLNEDLTGGKGTMFHLAKVIDEERMI